ncbi:MAG: CsgG/HfaB family protein, partial [Emcibacteraceae bacterium]
MNFFKYLFAGFSLTILSVVLLVSTSLADVEVVVVESEGRGISRDAAINAALSAAVAKVNGVSLTSNSRSISGQSSSQIENNSQSVSAISSRVDTQAAAQVRSRQYKNGQIPPVSDVTDVSVATTSRAQGIAVRASASKINNKTSYDASQKEIDVKTAGQIKSYEVLSFQEVPQGFIVRISASISKFVISIEAERTRIVVTPFRMKTRGNTTNEFERQFSQTLINQLTQSRKFAVLDRDYISEQGVELNLLQAGEVPIDEMTKLGNKLGTDFIIVGAVDEFVSRRRNLIMKSTGQEIPMIDQGARLSYRIINAATGQVKFSDTYDSIETKQGTAIASKIIANKAANEVSQNILMNFYPVMVEAIQGDT